MLDGFICPITKAIMREPMMSLDGHSYEKEAIEEWFHNGKKLSPATGKKLPSLKLIPNYNLKKAIQDYLKKRNEMIAYQKQLKIIDKELCEKFESEIKFTKELKHSDKKEPLSSSYSSQGLMALPKAASYSKQIEIQNKLVLSCEYGDDKTVSKLLKNGALADVPDKDSKLPLGAGIWGMNPRVVTELIISMGSACSMTWFDLQIHNLKFYKEMFIIEDFKPHSYQEWHSLLEKLDKSLFIQSLHLENIYKQWPEEDIENWENLKSTLQRIQERRFFMSSVSWWLGSESLIRIFSGTASRCASYRNQIEEMVTNASLRYEISKLD